MANAGLSETGRYADFFGRQVVRMAVHWRDYVAGQQANVTALDEKQEQILRAIFFALGYPTAWPALRDLLETFAGYMERTGRWETWQMVLNRALALAGQVDDTAGRVMLSALQARLLQRQSRFKEVVAAYRRVIRLARQIGDEFNEARACSNLGFLYIEHNYWRRAEVLSCYALSIFEQLDNDHGRAHTDNHLGFLYIRQQRWSLAQYHLERALKIWHKMNDDHGLMRVYINLSLLNIELERPQKVLEYSEKALAKAQLTKEEMELGTIYMNMGIAYRLMGLPTKAEQYAWRAEAVFHRFANVIGLAWVKDNLGLAYLDQKRWSDSYEWLTSALETWRSLGSQIGEFRVLIYLIDYELARGEPQKAAAHLADLEQSLNQNGKEAYHFLRERIANYRRSLAENLSQ